MSNPHPNPSPCPQGEGLLFGGDGKCAKNANVDRRGNSAELCAGMR
jgi:hypothetical protein